MRVILALLLASLLVSQGCQSTVDEGDCEEFASLEGDEFVIFREGGNQFLSSIPGELAYLSCESFETADGGFDSIYAVFGEYRFDCESGSCIQVDSVGTPFCEVDYNLDTAVVSDLFDNWDIAWSTRNDERLYPSCRTPELELNFERNENTDSTFPHLAEGTVGENTVALSFDLSGDTIVIGQRAVGNNLGGPYVELVENNLLRLLSSDTVLFRVNFNELVLKPLDAGDSIVLIQ